MVKLLSRKTILSYFLKCKKNQKTTEGINPLISKTKNCGTWTLSKCALRGSKKSRFMKKQEVKGFLSNTGLK